VDDQVTFDYLILLYYCTLILYFIIVANTIVLYIFFCKLIEQVLSTELIEDGKNDKPSSSSNIQKECSDKRVSTKPTVHNKESRYIYDIFD